MFIDSKNLDILFERGFRVLIVQSPTEITRQL